MTILSVVKEHVKSASLILDVFTELYLSEQTPCILVYFDFIHLGTLYPLRDFIGPYIQNNNSPKNLHQITIYLAPGKIKERF